MSNERRSSKLQFTPQRLRELGYVEMPDGSWARKPANDAVDSLEASFDSKPKGALDPAVKTRPKRKIRRPKGNIRDRAPVLTVTMTAHIPIRMDGDNLANALKPVRDELAAWLGVDDADGRIRWECGQVETRGAVGVCVTLGDRSKESI